MNKCKLGAITLPLNFTYTRGSKPRISELATLGGNVIQDLGTYTEDEVIAFSCALATTAVKDSIETLFLAKANTTFLDLDSVTVDVFITKFTYKERAGHFDLDGELRVR